MKHGTGITEKNGQYVNGHQTKDGAKNERRESRVQGQPFCKCEKCRPEDHASGHGNDGREEPNRGDGEDDIGRSVPEASFCGWRKRNRDREKQRR